MRDRYFVALRILADVYHVVEIGQDATSRNYTVPDKKRWPDRVNRGSFSRMTVKCVVPTLHVPDIHANRAFYSAFLGMDMVMVMDWIVTFASATCPNVQVSVITNDATAPMVADITVEVDDVDHLHTMAIVKGFDIVYPLTDEPWGARRFFVRDPNGKIVNIVSHE
jgi:catechol 2,3-dioxygenase-like lactoylglutathione lyase family enzyme